MHRLLQDLRYAVRQLRRSPGFALTAVLTLALGVGANCAIFSLLDQALLRSLPVHAPQQLVILEGTGTSKARAGSFSSQGGDDDAYFSYPMYRDIGKRSDVFDGVIATTSTQVGLSRNNQPSVVPAEVVSGNYFQVLGTGAALGRVLNSADDNLQGNYQVAVLSYGFWKDKLGADPGIVGQTVQLNGHPTQIVGVAAPNFHSAVWGQTPAIFAPMAMETELAPNRPKWFSDRRNIWLNIVGRLKPGETRQEAEARLAPMWHSLRADELKAMGQRSPLFIQNFLTDSRLIALPGARGLSYTRDGLETPLLVVMGMALLVLCIAGVNVAGLLLVRSSGRVREFAVRYAMGATARRILSQLLMEGLMVGLFGAFAGLILAPVAMRSIASQLVSPGSAGYFTTGIDTRLLLFAFVAAVLVSVLFSMAPALQLLRPDMASQLKQQAGTAGNQRLGFRRAVVGLQIGLSVLLLVGAGLFLQTLRNLRKADVGFNTAHLLSFSIDPQLADIPKARTPALHTEILQRMAALPGVVSVGAVDNPELAYANGMNNISIQGYTPGADEDMNVLEAEVSANYLQTLEVPLLSGRYFTESDDAMHPLVVLVNKSVAKRFFGSSSVAIGHFLAIGAGNDLKWRQIVGVVDDVHHSAPRDPVKPSYYMPLKQDPDASQITVYLRTVAEPLATAALARNTMHDIDPGLALRNLQNMQQQIDLDLVNERMIGFLAVSFSVLATALAGIGLYGVLAFSVTQRTREIGIRMALGSTRGGVAQLVLADVLRLAGVGIAVALPLALLAARSLRSQLYGVSSTDPFSAIAAVVLIGLVSVLAALLPARRAASIHPNTALRTE